MTRTLTKGIIASLLNEVDIQINGTRIHDIQVHTDNFYRRLLRDPILGLGEGYVAKEWDCAHLDCFFYTLLRTNGEKKIYKNLFFSYFILKSLFNELIAHFWNRQSVARAPAVAQQHYDKGNLLYTLMLDRTLNYSCGYWKQADSLDAAQRAKFAVFGVGFHSNCLFFSENFPNFFEMVRRGELTQYIDKNGQRKEISWFKKCLLVPAFICALSVGLVSAALLVKGIMAFSILVFPALGPSIPLIIGIILGLIYGIRLDHNDV